MCVQPKINNDIVCMFNGEIYNYKNFKKSASSEIEVLIELYEEYGDNFIKKLDGEFAIALIDFKNNKLIISTDTFECKPLYFAKQDNFFGVASLKSGLLRLGFKRIKELRANTTLIFKLSDLTYTKNNVTDFDIDNEHKKCFDDWEIAFENAVLKRFKNINDDVNVIVDLSEGYDTGAIVACLQKHKIDKPIVRSVISQEEFTNVLKWRHGINNKPYPKNSYNEYFTPVSLTKKVLIKYDEKNFNKSSILFKNNVENYTAIIMSREGKLERTNVNDHFSKYTYYEGRKFIKSNNVKVIITGCGGDGVSSPFINKIYRKYNSIWPCLTFRMNTPYLTEVVQGSWGVEFRYPYYDKALWQESFWLDKSISKNHKPSLHNYLDKNKMPFFEVDDKNNPVFTWIGWANWLYNSVPKQSINTLKEHFNQPEFWNE